MQHCSITQNICRLPLNFNKVRSTFPTSIFCEGKKENLVVFAIVKINNISILKLLDYDYSKQP